MRLLSVAILAFVLTGCATDYEYSRPYKYELVGTVANPSNAFATWYRDCSAWLDRREPVGPVPDIRWVNEAWLNYYGEIAIGAYVSETNSIYVVRRKNSGEVIAHEMKHADEFHRGEPYSEKRAYKISRWFNDCVHYFRREQ